MTGRDAARDELVATIAERIATVNTVGWHDVKRTADAIADGLIEHGYRKVTVTPEQVDAAAATSWGAYWDPTEAPWHDQSRSRRETWTVAIRAALESAGLSVAEDGAT